MSYQSKTAKILIDIKAINFNFKSPYILTSGRKSPVYVDCRKIISFTKERSQIISFIQKYIIKHNIKFDLLYFSNCSILFGFFRSKRERNVN